MSRLEDFIDKLRKDFEARVNGMASADGMVEASAIDILADFEESMTYAALVTRDGEVR